MLNFTGDHQKDTCTITKGSCHDLTKGNSYGIRHYELFLGAPEKYCNLVNVKTGIQVRMLGGIVYP